MLRNLFLKTLRDRRRGLIGWSIGVAGFSVMTGSFYPSVRDSAADLTKLTEKLPEGLLALFGGEIDFASSAGYLDSRMFAFLAPVLLLIFAVAFGARTVAGEEQDGRLELVLASPMPRRLVVAEKLAALIVSILLLGAAMWLPLALGSSMWGLDLPASRLLAAFLSTVLLTLTFGTLALLIGCASGRQGLASSTSATLAVATYLLNAYSSLVDVLEPWRFVSPWHYYDAGDVLRGGIEPGNILVLSGLILLFSTGAIVSFDRRDVGV